MYECESGNMKNMKSTEELMVLSCGARANPWESLGQQGISNQSILKEINSKYSLEGLMLKLKLQYFHHPMHRANSLEKILMLEKIENKRRRWVAEYEMIT